MAAISGPARARELPCARAGRRHRGSASHAYPIELKACSISSTSLKVCRFDMPLQHVGTHAQGDAARRRKGGQERIPLDPAGRS